MTTPAATRPKPGREERIDRHFSGPRARWRPTYEQLLAELTAFGPGVTASPTDSYISLLRKGRKFGIVQVTGDRLDVGIKLRGAAATGRLEPSGDWNQMVSHRVRVTNPAEADAQLVGWLRQAYDNEGS
jgi:hypothetical protein